MNNFSIVGLLMCIAVVFLVLKAGDNHAVKTDRATKETNTKLLWVSVISCLAFLGFLVITGS